MHVPKTAGSSMIGALAEALRPAQITSGFDRLLFGGFDDFASFDSSLRKIIYLSADTLPEAEFVAGHMSYETVARRFPDAQFTTVLREPLSRLLSLWIFWRGHGDDRLAAWGSWADEVRRARRDLASFLQAPSLACQNDNQTVRMLLSPHRLIPTNGFIEPRNDAQLLAACQARLQGFAHADILENPDFAANWQHWLGATLTIPRVNETTPVPDTLRSPLEVELTADAMEWLQCLSRLDLQLWRHVACWRLTETATARLRETTQWRGIARFATMMSRT